MIFGMGGVQNYGGRSMGPANVDAKSRALRMKEWESYVAANPGAGEGGTGQTGLLPTDRQGWSWILDKRKQYADDMNALQGKGPLQTRSVTYDGTSGVLAPRKQGQMPHNALRGLSDAAVEDTRGRLPQWITDDPEMYKAFTDSQFDQFQARGRQARREGMSPIEKAGEVTEARLRYDPYTAALDRDLDYQDTMNEADARSDAYFTHLEPMDRRRNELQIDLAREKGEAAAYDDTIRADAARYGADQRRAGTEATAAARSRDAAMAALGREVGNARQYGDDTRVGQLTGQFDDMTRGGGPSRMGGPAPAQSGQQFSPEIEQQIARATAGGKFTREQVIERLRQRGLIK